MGNVNISVATLLAASGNTPRDGAAASGASDTQFTEALTHATANTKASQSSLRQSKAHTQGHASPVRQDPTPREQPEAERTQARRESAREAVRQAGDRTPDATNDEPAMETSDAESVVTEQATQQDSTEQDSDAATRDETLSDANAAWLLMMGATGPITPAPGMVVATDSATGSATGTATVEANALSSIAMQAGAHLASATSLQSNAATMAGMTPPTGHSVQTLPTTELTADTTSSALARATNTAHSALATWLTPTAGTESATQELLASFAAMTKQSDTRALNERVTDSGSEALRLLNLHLNASGEAVNTQVLQDLSASATNSSTLAGKVGSAAWTEELGNKLVVMAKTDTPVATLHVTPADLGPVQIRIETKDSQTNVWFTASHADTRSAIEQSLPRLREMLQAQGLQLNDAGVFGERSQQQAEYSAPKSTWWQGTHNADSETSDSLTLRTLSVGMVDTYA